MSTAQRLSHSPGTPLPPRAGRRWRDRQEYSEGEMRSDREVGGAGCVPAGAAVGGQPSLRKGLIAAARKDRGGSREARR